MYNICDYVKRKNLNKIKICEEDIITKLYYCYNVFSEYKKNP